MNDHKYVDFYIGIELIPKYYYKVSINVITLEKINRNFDHVEIFEDPDLIKCRNNAIAYYYDQMRGINEKGTYHNFPFTSYKNSEIEKTAAFSVYLIFCRENSRFFTQYIISGEGDKEHTLTDLTDEYLTLLDLGYEKNQIAPFLSDGITLEELFEEVNKRII
jgi:hypothetical protein